MSGELWLPRVVLSSSSNWSVSVSVVMRIRQSPSLLAFPSTPAKIADPAGTTPRL
jgi:hypothetical protein